MPSGALKSGEERRARLGNCTSWRNSNAVVSVCCGAKRCLFEIEFRRRLRGWLPASLTLWGFKGVQQNLLLETHKTCDRLGAKEVSHDGCVRKEFAASQWTLVSLRWAGSRPVPLTRVQSPTAHHELRQVSTLARIVAPKRTGPRKLRPPTSRQIHALLRLPQYQGAGKPCQENQLNCSRLF